MFFNKSKDAKLAAYTPLRKMPMIRTMFVYQGQSRINKIHAGMRDRPFANGTAFQYNVLSIPSEMTEKRSSGVMITYSESVKGMVCIPKGIEQALRKLCSGSGGRIFWIRSACIDHNDTFEADYYKGSYLFSVYARATNVYIWNDCSRRKDTVAMDWIAAAAAEIKARSSETWSPDSKLRLPLNKHQDTALVNCFSCPAFLDVEIWALALAALDSKVPTYILSERGQINLDDTYTICGYLITAQQIGLSSDLSSLMAKIKGVNQQALSLASEIPDTIPDDVVYRTEAMRKFSQDMRDATINRNVTTTRRYESHVGSNPGTTFTMTTSYD